MSWNDLELNRRSMEMKTTASLFADHMRKADLASMKKKAEAMKRTAEMAIDRLKELGCE